MAPRPRPGDARVTPILDKGVEEGLGWDTGWGKRRPGFYGGRQLCVLCPGYGDTTRDLESMSLCSLPVFLRA